MEPLTYKGYSVYGIYSPEDSEYFGRIDRLYDCLLVEAATPEEFETRFHEAVDNYLELCAQIGKKPEAPMDIRKYVCPHCKSFFFVDCDANDYPECCPYCGLSIDGRNDKYESYEILYGNFDGVEQ